MSDIFEVSTTPCVYCGLLVHIVFCFEGDKDWACGRCTNTGIPAPVRQR